MKEVVKLFEELNQLWGEFVVNHQKFVEGTKIGAARARKALNAMKKICTPYKKASMEAQKNLK